MAIPCHLDCEEALHRMSYTIAKSPRSANPRRRRICEGATPHSVRIGKGYGSLGEVSPEGHREDREEQNHGPGQLESVHVCRAT